MVVFSKIEKFGKIMTHSEFIQNKDCDMMEEHDKDAKTEHTKVLGYLIALSTF